MTQKSMLKLIKKRDPGSDTGSDTGYIRCDTGCNTDRYTWSDTIADNMKW